MNAAEGDIVLLAEELVSLVGLGEPILNRLQVVAGQERCRDLGATGKSAVGGEPFENFLIFENTQSAWVHNYHLVKP